MCSAPKDQQILWSPWELLQGSSGSENYAIVVLNQSIKFKGAEVSIVANLWNAAKIRVTVDGGTDRWLKWQDENHLNLSTPDLVTGDMDSIHPDTLKRFQNSSSTKVVFTLNQDETDFTKSLIELNSLVKRESLNIDCVLVICEAAGRFDHLISNVNTLYKAGNIFEAKTKVFVMSTINLTWLLNAGQIVNRIVVPDKLVQEKKACGMLPFGQSCRVTSKGLKWNLDDDVMEFGNLISTSNTYSETVVTIKTDHALIWTMEIENLLPSLYID